MSVPPLSGNTGAERVNEPSNVGFQRPSKGGLLAAISKKHDYVPGRLSPTAFFSKRKVVKEYRETLASRFSDSEKAAAYLDKKDLPQLEQLESVTDHPLAKKQLDAFISRGDSKSCEFLLKGVATADAWTPRLNQLLGGRLGDGDVQKLGIELGLAFAALGGEQVEFQRALLQIFDKIAQQQEKRPELMSVDSADFADLSMLIAQVDQMSRRAGISEVGRLLEELTETVCPMNAQVVMENLQACFAPETVRTLPCQRPRSAARYCLHQEQHPPVDLHRDRGEVDCRGLQTEVLICDAQTGETFTIKIPLPMGEKLSTEEAKKRVRLLAAHMAGESEFQKVSEEYGGVSEDLQAAIASFTENCIHGLGEGLADFNATKSHPRRFFSRSQPKTAAFLRLEGVLGTERFANALAAATEGSVYQQEDGHLSLLPPEALSKMQLVGTLLPDEWEALCEAYDAPKPVTLLVPREEEESIAVKPATFTFEKESGVRWGSVDREFMRVTMKLERDGIEVQRVCHYPVGEELGPLLERDCLLTKSAFIAEELRRE